MERIYPTKDDINKVLESYRLENHIERYQIIKRYCYGSVLDIACGVGYGSHLLENNPDINSIVGVDVDLASITFAVKEYSSRKVKFSRKHIQTYSDKHDVLVSLETIEHINELTDFQSMVSRVDPNVLILSFPNKRSTHFNRYHKHDLNSQQVTKLFGNFVIVKQIFQHDITIMVFIKKPDKMPKYLFDTLV
jgi:2-polyprenyl-3-methyl-5-hydroxy-6-metoxy-1,4-benzoquinol methylase